MQVSKLYSDKLNGLILMQEEELPVLPFVILNQKKDLESQVSDFLKNIKQEKFCARADDPYSQMGKASIIDGTLENIEDLKKLGKGHNLFISHPGDVYKNLHSVNILKNDEEVIIEAIGPGFITPDMDKYGLVHERILFDLGMNEISNEVVVDKKTYANHVTVKIGNKKDKHLQNNSFLLRFPDYLPLTKQEINFIKLIFPKLSKVAERMGYGKFVASLSFIEMEDGIKPIFWDIFGITR